MTAPLRPSELAIPSEPGVGDAAASAGVLRPAWADVDLDALVHNLETMRLRVGSARILAVVKANAYGHGAAAVGLALERAGVDWLGVALVEEGAQLRRAGARSPILVLGTAQPAQLPLYRRYDLVPTISSLDQLRLWTSWVSLGATAQPFHLKVDTGMTRLGLGIDEVPAALEAIRREPRLKMTGILSHLADADLLASPLNAEQRRRFAEVLRLLTPAERHQAALHLANSAGALHHPESHFSLVRLGLALYGLDPAAREAGLQPVMSVRAKIVQLRDVEPGTRLGYGGKRVVERPSRIAVVPVGYADGYSWRLSDKAEALVHGRRVPVAGAVSMDMTLLDVTGTPAELGDEVVLMGRQGAEEITAAELALVAGTVPYELLCLLGLRLTRRYFRNGAAVDVHSRFMAGSI